MALITAQDVIDYSVFARVKTRDPKLLDYDILQAETETFQIVGHKFDDATQYPTLPEQAKLAIIKLTEYYALVNSDESMAKGIKSESIGNYSYTLSDGTTVQKPMLESLLSEYILPAGTGSGTKARFKMRSV